MTLPFDNGGRLGARWQPVSIFPPTYACLYCNFCLFVLYLSDHSLTVHTAAPPSLQIMAEIRGVKGIEETTLFKEMQLA